MILIINNTDVKIKLKLLGFSFYRQAKGSHSIWLNEKTGKKITDCNHNSQEVGTGLAKKILKEAGFKI